ncbi:uncharacterized protein A4U43_C02F3600 [Asparagus officinalis]|uniref:Uncharacterized protein n=1 Tax=Asparagus officinalis TaxID=4686 RepID=A0A5P1FJN7_ASPOF|nr:uncharacterized protein LOC109830045 [Asparagus officinalis]ONK77149.1 uncharacterized protein A4U43_C02F3600 [Asparagus officinalis]
MVVGEETEDDGDGAYWIFREKAEKITCKLEMVAETIAKILSQYVKIQSHSAKIQKMHSVISLRKYDNSNQLSGYATKHYDSTLSLHITGDDHKFRIRSPDSNCFTLPTGFILFTVGKHFEEISDGELKCFNGEIFVDPSDDSLTPLSLEFMYTLPVLNHVPSHSLSKAASIMDQLLVLLVLVFLYNLCS